MRKVLFLMFLLLLMGLGAASVKAQVRIGGNTAPSAAAVLDLNATDATNTGTRGLVLPRVDLTSNTMQLTNGVANVTGTLVYNTTATSGQIGVYYWNGTKWVQASLPATSAADSGLFLMSLGNTVVWEPLDGFGVVSIDTIPSITVMPNVTWLLSADFTATLRIDPGTHYRFLQSHVSPNDLCIEYGGYGTWVIRSTAGYVYMREIMGVRQVLTIKVRCYTPVY